MKILFIFSLILLFLNGNAQEIKEAFGLKIGEDNGIRPGRQKTLQPFRNFREITVKNDQFGELQSVSSICEMKDEETAKKEYEELYNILCRHYKNGTIIENKNQTSFIITKNEGYVKVAREKKTLNIIYGERYKHYQKTVPNKSKKK